MNGMPVVRKKADESFDSSALRMMCSLQTNHIN